METTRTYNGYTIALTEDWRFKISGPILGTDERCEFDDLRSAKAYIDQRLKQHEAQTRERLSIPVLDETGNPVTITGAHGGHYGMLGVGSATTVYPALPKVAELLAERGRLDERRRAVNEVLHSVRIETRSQYGVRSHPNALLSIKERVAKATARATSCGGTGNG